MFTEYIQYVMQKNAVYELIDSGKTYYGELKGFKGVWVQAKTLRECEKSLQDVLEEWLLLKIRKQQFVPTTSKYDINALLST